MADKVQMGAVQFIENLDRTTLSISDPDFERYVETAVSAMAERQRVNIPMLVAVQTQRLQQQ